MISALFIVLFGARIYKKIVADADTNYNARTAIAYFSEKLRQHDTADGVEVIRNGDAPVLRLTEVYGDNIYYTYLYESDGYIKEITSPADYEPMYDTGQNILPVSSFLVEKTGELLYRFDITDEDGNRLDFYVALCSHAQGQT